MIILGLKITAAIFFLLNMIDEAAITIMIILGLSSLPWVHTLMGLEEGP
jgi:hypothetical protein